MVVEVGPEIEQLVFEVCRRPEQQVIQVFAPQGADQPFHVWVEMVNGKPRIFGRGDPRPDGTGRGSTPHEKPTRAFKLTKSEGVAEGTTASYFIRDTSEGPVCRLDPTTFTMGVDVLVESKIEGINSVVEELMRLLPSNCCSREHEFAVQTALREALANALSYGNHGDTSKKVRTCCDCGSAKGILIVIRDEGEGFNLAKVPSPLIGEHAASEHGRGIFLINMFMDETHFRNGDRSRNLLPRLLFYACPLVLFFWSLQSNSKVPCCPEFCHCEEL